MALSHYPNSSVSMEYKSPALEHARLLLLEQIDRYGSISRAAKQINLSYRTAWNSVDAMNNLSRYPLLRYSAMGGTHLTRYGRVLVDAWRDWPTGGPLGATKHYPEIERQLRAFMFGSNMRNHFRGRVTGITREGALASVTLDIGSRIQLLATLSEESLEEFRVDVGTAVLALIHPDAVMLTPDCDVRISARNRLKGKVLDVALGPVNSEIKLRLSPSRTLTALVTNASANELALSAGQECTALFKASQVMLAQA
ncbi:TOBE domain-containing protein [Stutzerimonas tarimensis]|uniref:TOBE domain-containing protein n=1 Tax=Stutzerimonas tarimensis TaxID=1507735 RepID=A0ABV7TC37_9GAMM